MLPSVRLIFVVALPFVVASALPAVAGAQDPARTATIHRDVWGVPHVSSETDQGAVFGMAWALAEDDWPLIEENYLHALGRHAELVGEESVPDDWMARALEIVPLSVREYESGSPRLRGLLQAWAAGLNAWLDSRPVDDLRVLRRIEPWYPLALIRYKYYQNEFLGYAGLRQAWAERMRERAAAAVAAGEMSPVPPGPGPRPQEGAARYHEAQFDELGFRPRGSNQWALAPSRTASGAAMLLINPHQSFVGVQRYAEIHLDSSEGLRFSGLTVFGFVLPYMGNNEHLGWAYTDNYADHSDLFAESFDDPEVPLRYRFGGDYRTARTWTDSVRVRTPGGMESRTFRFWATHHGPLVGVDDRGLPLAVRMARYEEGGWFDQWDGMIRASSVEAWRAAYARLSVAYMNTMYADREGNIGYVYGSAVPRRLPGVDPGGVLDGSDPRTEWQGFHALEELPQVWNPPSGWLLNANSTPFTATTDLPFDRSDFPAYMVGPETDNGRARRARVVLEGMTDVTLEGFASDVWDSYLIAADEIVSELEREWARLGEAGADTRGHVGAVSVPGIERGTEAWRDLRRAVEGLVAWDRIADTASVETTWFVLLVEERARSGGAGPTGGSAGGSSMEPTAWSAALARSLEALRSTWDSIDVPWGRLNRHQRPEPGGAVTLDPDRPSLPVGGASGGLGSVFSYYSRPVAGPAGPRIGTGGNSFVKVIEFTDTPRGMSVLNYGQSGDPGSAHFFDQAALYVQRRFKPSWFDRAEVEANASRSYVVSGGR